MTLQEFRNKIQFKNVEGNHTFLYITVNGCKYGQSYQNAVNTLEDMKNRFVMFYYPMTMCDDCQTYPKIKGHEICKRCYMANWKAYNIA